MVSLAEARFSDAPVFLLGLVSVGSGSLGALFSVHSLLAPRMVEFFNVPDCSWLFVTQQGPGALPVFGRCRLQVKQRVFSTVSLRSRVYIDSIFTSLCSSMSVKLTPSPSIVF